MIKGTDLIKPLKFSWNSQVWECIWQGKHAVLKKGIALERELNILRRGHPLLPKLLFWQRQGKGLLMIREWLEGQTITELCNTRGLMGINIIDQVAESMLALRGGTDRPPFIHGDLSPDNILILKDKTRIIDLENAAWAQEIPVMGIKKAFAAPEVIRKGLCTVKGDIYSLAKTMEFCGLSDSRLEAMMAHDPADRPGSWTEILAMADRS